MKSVVLLGLALANSIFTSAERGDWSVAHSRAKTALTKLTQEDKLTMVTGAGWQKGACVGNTAAVLKIGYPQLCLQDGPLGVRYPQGVTAFPAGITTGSTWDVDLMYDRGFALGQESKGLGIHVQLGPVGGPLGKFPEGGRNWEGFSNDPYLSGISMAQTVKGMQTAGVQACAKHFIGNEQEYLRTIQSANIDDRVLHELYLWPFADAVKANVTSVMCSYNKFNSTWACENPALIDLLKDELAFEGYVMSDWGAQHTTIESANAGLDMSMPGDYFKNPNSTLWGPALSDAISNGTVSQARLDDMVTRILAAWYFVGQDGKYPNVTGWSSWNGGKGGPDVQGDHKSVARAVARDGIVLLKNTNNTLPLRKPSSLAVIGYDAVLNSEGANACVDRKCDNGTLAMGFGSGTAEFPYLIAPYDAIKAQASKDGTAVTLSGTDVAKDGARAATSAEIALVFINSDSGEQYLTVEGNQGDRNDLEAWHNGSDLVTAVADVNKQTIVVVHSVGPINLEPFINLPSVVAVVWAGLPGQESGNALVDILYGSTSPSGKLPYTIAKARADYGAKINKGNTGDDDYEEGLYIDYRRFDKYAITPRYEFGFGLSYTTFEYSNMSISALKLAPGNTGKGPGGVNELYDIVGSITVTIANNGTRAGAEVAQLYIGFPSSAPVTPVKQLRGFSKLALEPGTSGMVAFPLRRKDLSFWDGKKWLVPEGAFDVMVGASSRDLRLTGSLKV